MTTQRIAVLSALWAIVAALALVKCATSFQAVMWGPGLQGNFTLPVRYVFIKILDEYGESVSNVSKQDVHVEFRKSSSNAVKEFQADLLHTAGDNSTFLFRFRPHRPHHGDLIMSVFYKNQNLTSKVITGPILPEECDCPSGIQNWLFNQARCPPVSQQILNDLKPFPTIRPSYNRKVMQTFYDQPYSVSLCNYIIKQNRIYRKCIGEYTGFSMFVDTILISLVRKVKLPDVDFIVNLGDYPLGKKNEHRYSPQIPIFSWCGSDDSVDIVMPTYELVDATVHMMHRVALDLFSVQDRANQPFKDRLSSAFWRGRDSREERLRLVELSRSEPQLLNASITNFFFFRDRMEKFGGKTPHINFFKFFQYKYQVNVDGTVAAYRMPFLLAGGSTVLKTHPSPFYEHFYHLLEENVHFIGVRPDLSDLMEKIRFCLFNEEHCARVARNGQELINKHLLPHHVYCYHAQLLQEYAQRIEGYVEVPEGMEFVDHRQDIMCDCSLSKDGKMTSETSHADSFKNEL